MGQRQVADFVRQQAVREEDLEPYLEAINPGRNIVSILEYAVDVHAALMGMEKQGDTLPWRKTHENFRMRPGEVTLWFGVNGHGKSAVTTQVALWLALQGKASCIASFEMLPAVTLLRMLRQCAGNPDPSEKFTNHFLQSLCNHIWIYDKHGRVETAKILAAIRYCADKKKTTHFFIDSLMKCVAGEDDYNGQKDFVADLCDVAKETETHIHLIHHSRKLANEDAAPNKFDAKGTGAITDQVDNVIAVWRNKPKERDDEKALAMGAALSAEGPDFVLACDKQRNGGWEGSWAMWGDRKSWHFRETPKPGWMKGYELPPLGQAEPGAAG